jgi:hypothetical protein
MGMTTAQLRTLKGCPGMVLWALMIARQDRLGPVGAEWIERATGYTDKPVDNALKFLEENQYITHNTRYGWQLGNGVMQLPLMMPELEAANEPLEPADKSEIDSEIFRLGNIPTPASSSSSGLTNRESRVDLPLTTKPPDPENFRVEQNLAECDAQGIREPSRSKLARMEHVTPELIRAHCQACGPENMGRAIYRIRENWRAPGIINNTYSVPEPWDEAPVVEVDEQAEAWWGQLVDRLREHVPKAYFGNLIQVEGPARKIDKRLEVLVVNKSSEDAIGKYLTPAGLDKLTDEISGGEVNAIRFVTKWEK